MKSAVSLTDGGLLCEKGGFSVDPWKPARRAVITYLLVHALSFLPEGTVLDGKILAYSKEEQLPLPFSVSQTRIGPKKLGPRMLSSSPVVFIAYDLLEHEGRDCRTQPLEVRRRKLVEVLSFAYQMGRRANLYTDYTFGVWRGEELVPVAKAYSGLTDNEINSLDHWIRRHKKQKFGPVRSVEPLQVFELAFEGIAVSSRHRAGVAVRFPRILRWSKDKVPSDADTPDRLKDLIHVAA